MKNHLSENSMNSCIEKCEKCIKSCQKLMSLCEVKSGEDCAEQVGLCIINCQECVKTCSKVIKEIELHAQECDDCKVHLKILQGCVAACNEHIDVLNNMQQSLPSNISGLDYRADVNKLIDSTKKCIDKLKRIYELVPKK